MKKQTILLFSIILLAATCGKDDIKPIDQLPPATTEGKNTFGCLINGEAWVAHIEDNPILWGDNVVDAQYDDEKYLKIVAERDINSQEIDQTLILLATVTPNVSFFRRSSNLADYNDNCDAFYLDTLIAQQLTITRLDIENKIISGLFGLTIISDDCSDTIRITEGRFDLPYHY